MTALFLLLASIGLHDRLRAASAATAAGVVDHDDLLAVLLGLRCIQMRIEHTEQQNCPELHCSLVHFWMVES